MDTSNPTMGSTGGEGLYEKLHRRPRYIPAREPETDWCTFRRPRSDAAAHSHSCAHPPWRVCPPTMSVCRLPCENRLSSRGALILVQDSPRTHPGPCNAARSLKIHRPLNPLVRSTFWLPHTAHSDTSSPTSATLAGRRATVVCSLDSASPINPPARSRSAPLTLHLYLRLYPAIEDCRSIAPPISRTQTPAWMISRGLSLIFRITYRYGSPASRK